MLERKKRLIVIGGGFGGISFVKSLKNENVEIHTWQNVGLQDFLDHICCDTPAYILSSGPYTR